MTEDEMVGWHHRINGHELGQAPGDSEGLGGLASYSSLSHKELDTTWQLNNKNTWEQATEQQKYLGADRKGIFSGEEPRGGTEGMGK